MQFSLTFTAMVVTFVQTEDCGTNTGRGMLFVKDTSASPDGPPKVIFKSCSAQQAAAIACLGLLGDGADFSATALYTLADEVVDDIPLNLRPIP